MEDNLVENIDYYINENGFFVFTKAYHLKRGYCCGNNCKHCPWKDDGNSESENESESEN